MPWAIIHQTSDRYEEWMRVFGAARVPIESTQPIANRLDPNAAAVLGSADKTLFLLVAWEQLAPDVQTRALAWLAEKFNLRIEEVMLDVARHGIPILFRDLDIEESFLPE